MENKVEKFAVAMIVNNRFGVLNRIAGLYAKRCYNIDNISAGTLDDPNYTRITIDVRAVTLLEPENTVFAQHMYIKMHLTGSHRGSSKHQVLDLINEYGGKVVDFGEEHLTAEITGDSKKVESFIEKVRGFGILELSRSGEIAIGLGIDNTLRVDHNEE